MEILFELKSSLKIVSFYVYPSSTYRWRQHGCWQSCWYCVWCWSRRSHCWHCLVGFKSKFSCALWVTKFATFPNFLKGFSDDTHYLRLWFTCLLGLFFNFTERNWSFGWRWEKQTCRIWKSLLATFSCSLLVSHSNFYKCKC